MTRILVVEDEPLIRLSIEGALEDAGFEICGAPSAEEAREVIKRENNFDMIISDNNMRKELGIDFLRYARTLFPRVKTLLITGQASHIEHLDMPVLSKPFNEAKLLTVVNSMLQSPGLAA